MSASGSAGRTLTPPCWEACLRHCPRPRGRSEPRRAASASSAILSPARAQGQPRRLRAFLLRARMVNTPGPERSEPSLREATVSPARRRWPRTRPAASARVFVLADNPRRIQKVAIFPLDAENKATRTDRATRRWRAFSSPVDALQPVTPTTIIDQPRRRLPLSQSSPCRHSPHATSISSIVQPARLCPAHTQSANATYGSLPIASPKKSARCGR